jgi:hypothetical protein
MQMRWSILRTLLHKEVRRHLANRGGLALALLLVVAALLLSVFGKGESQVGSLVGGVNHCFVDYWEECPWLDHLRQHVPPELKQHVRFRQVSERAMVNGTIVYPTGTAAIQLRPIAEAGQAAKYKVWFWHPGAEGAGLAPFEAWFWKETHRFFQQRAAAAWASVGEHAPPDVALADLTEERSQLRGGLDPRSGIATALVLFALFFVCVYLLPSLTCEERERGVLLAQALSPASALEILAAKFLFYPVAGMALATLLAGLYDVAVLARPLFWLALLVAALGSLGIGLTIASLARTQRAASMGALCYMMAVALLLFICQQSNIPFVPYLALEYHAPRILHAVLADAILGYHWGHLAGAAVLACLWSGLAIYLFRRCGWQ